MAPSILKKRKREPENKSRPTRASKKIKKQSHYSSSSSSASLDGVEPSDFPPMNLASSASSSDIDLENDKDDVPPDNEQGPSISQTSHSSPSSSDSETISSNPDPNPTTPLRPSRSKRNDPTAFSTAITSILSSKLPTTKRADPVLARSSAALAATRELKDAHVEKLAKQSLRAEKKAAGEKGRVKDVFLGTVSTGGVVEATGEAAGTGDGEVGRMVEQERRLKKTAQRGVVKLFNAVRMAQVRGEEARKEAVGKGIVGAKRKEEKVGEMSKKGFLELVSSGGGGGGKAKAAKMSGKEVEEA
ncbi:pre-60S ribosomal particles component [Xanthoria calcicola]